MDTKRLKKINMKKLNEVILYSDGASSGNPGKAGAGWLLYDKEGNLIKKNNQFLGIATNNVAEYMALICGLETALALRAKKVICFLDSELLVKQLRGDYKVRNNILKLLYYQVNHLKGFFKGVSFNHIQRLKNKEADKLAKRATKGERE